MFWALKYNKYESIRGPEIPATARNRVQRLMAITTLDFHPQVPVQSITYRDLYNVVLAGRVSLFLCWIFLYLFDNFHSRFNTEYSGQNSCIHRSPIKLIQVPHNFVMRRSWIPSSYTYKTRNFNIYITSIAWAGYTEYIFSKMHFIIENDSWIQIFLN